MKVLFDHGLPFSLAHGGFQIQIEQTRKALDQCGVEVEFLRWWDEHQTGDIIHYFGRPGGGYVDFAHQRGLKVVVAELHTSLGSRSARARFLQKGIMRAVRSLLPGGLTGRLSWDTYRQADAFVALTKWEAYLMQSMFDADPARIHVVPNGVEPVFFRPHVGGPFLICTAAIHPRKRVLELAAAAAHARVPVWIIGKPYAESDPYYQRFVKLQRENAEWIRYEGAISDRGKLAQIYSEARGFVLLSTQESLSLSALEAAAGGCPLLLSDLPWAREVFGPHAVFASVKLTQEKLASVLADFPPRASSLPVSFIPRTWPEIADLLVAVYRQLMTA